ncbi:MAG: hypothetical protein JWP48_4428 [Actinoallomurus sp.]|jgi:hypothetical protein|nr:hypothetical protein [Actinoallomurus sp.]
MALASAMKNSTGALRRSVQRRSLPKLLIQEFVRSTTHRLPVWMEALAPRWAIWPVIPLA